MEQKLTCDTIRDLLPMYVDELTSEATNELVKEHISTCSQCSEMLENMKKPVSVETAPEVKDFKKYLKKSRISIFYWIMGAAAAIAILTCFIVNLAVSGTLSWFYIVVMGIVTGYLPVYIMMNSKKHPFVKGVAAAEVCVFLLLAVIQRYCIFQMKTGDLWFVKTAVPIFLLWSAFIWIAIACNLFFHVHPVIAVSIFAFLAVPGNFFTNWIVGEYEKPMDYFDTFVSNGLGNTAAAVVLLIIGIAISKRNNKHDAEE